MSNKTIEILSRMWIECDPNRSGANPDQPMEHMSGDLKGAPRWHWFKPRAEATLAFLEKHGLCITTTNQNSRSEG